MTATEQTFYRSLGSLGSPIGKPLPVTLSPELIGLLSEQLYRSPSKAIEELVVNAFDADANAARIFVSEPGNEAPFIVVQDDGVGMTYNGLLDLWKVGRPKSRVASLARHKQRKQIGKFGIGKLATYAVANQVTYLTKSADEYLGVTIDYRKFTSNPMTTTTAVELDVMRLDNLDALTEHEVFQTAIEVIGLSLADLQSLPSWTIVILEDLKDKARSMPLGRLRWVLRTAMPLSAQFKLYLNSEEIESSKEDYKRLVKFDISELPTERLDALQKKTGQAWAVVDRSLQSESFPSGISGDAFVTQQTLRGKVRTSFVAKDSSFTCAAGL